MDIMACWHNDEDLKHFKKTTLHNTILMGSKTFQTIGKALSERKTIVVSKKGVSYPDVEVVSFIRRNTRIF